MKLGSETGSVINHIHAYGVKGQPEPVVGMGVTILGWTDRYAGTIVKVEKIHGALYVHVKEDRAKRIDKNGMSESQEYEYSPNPGAATQTWRCKANGMWESVWFKEKTGRWNRSSGSGLAIGYRKAYHDFSF